MSGGGVKGRFTLPPLHVSCRDPDFKHKNVTRLEVNV